MRSYLTIALLFLLFLFGNEYLLGQNKAIFPAGTTEILIPASAGSKPYFSDLKAFRGEELIWIVDKKENIVYGYGQDSLNVVQLWDFKGLPVGEIRTFYIHNSDSVLFYSKNRKLDQELFWYFPVTKEFSRVAYAEGMSLVGMATDTNRNNWESIYASSASPVKYHKGKIYAEILQYMPANQVPEKRESIFFSLGNAPAIERIPIYQPDVYRNVDAISSHRSTYSLRIVDDFLISFSGSPTIIRWNSVTKEIDTINLEVPGIALKEPPAKMPNLSSVQMLLAYGYYGKIFYHQEKRLYLRVVYFPTPLIDPETQLLNTFDDRSAFLFVWDAEFNPIDFIELPKGSNANNAFCTSKGFAIFNPNQTVSDSLNHTLKYYNYEISR